MLIRDGAAEPGLDLKLQCANQTNIAANMGSRVCTSLGHGLLSPCGAGVCMEDWRKRSVWSIVTPTAAPVGLRSRVARHVHGAVHIVRRW